MTPDAVFETLESSAEGLGEGEAKSRLERYGSNEIRAAERLPRMRIFTRQLKSPLILLLVGAGGLTIALGEWLEAGAIFAAVVVNSILGFWQENKAESALAVLKSYVRTRARVRRDGREREVEAAELVRGDVIHVAQGDRVPADCRLVFASGLGADEAVLTGESLPVKKTAVLLPHETELADRANMLFSGTHIVEGFADALVVATGNDTEFGRIATLVSIDRHEPTPLQRTLSRFVVQVSIGLGLLVAGFFAFGIASGYDAFEMFLIAIAIAVSAVPEGLPIALTVILAIGVQRLAVRQGIVRRLLAAETLGSTSIILTDKTGTLTEARMSLAAVLPVSGDDPDARRALLEDALINTDVVLENPDAPPDEWELEGRPIEVALVRAAGREGIRMRARDHTRMLDRAPFNSSDKYSVALIERHGRREFVILGAPDIIVRFAALAAGARDLIHANIQARAGRGEKVIGLATGPAGDQESVPGDRRFGNLSFRGLIAFHDSLRPQAAPAIRRIAASGVETVMVTGDHAGTAEAIARELGMITNAAEVMTGGELDALSPAALATRLDSIRVWARVTPEQKMRLVEAYQHAGNVVAVTGDGVNDAPALKVADIGVAVGSGTDVAKSAADLVILDDNFQTIVAAIEEGRNILANIRKVIVYLLSTSLNELLLIGGALAAGLALPLGAIQILFINFFSDSFPAIALAFEREPDGLDRAPHGRRLFSMRMRLLTGGIAVINAVLLLVLYRALIAARFDAALVHTFLFASFATYSLWLAFSVRDLDRSIFRISAFSNPLLWGGIAIGLVLTLAAVYVPFLQSMFGTVALPWPWLAAVGILGFVSITIVECAKLIMRIFKL